MLKSTKKNIYFLLASFIAVLVVTISNKEPTLEELHQIHLQKIDSNKPGKLTKRERFKKGLPPNQFHEQIYELTINPATGTPDYDSKLRLQRKIEEGRKEGKPFAVPGESLAQPWYEIGPNDQAGRSRAALWDLNDGTNRAVFAGGVSGGLWNNGNITSGASNWTKVAGVPGNLAVSVIVQDPNDTNIMYLGTGESYTTGDATGNGIYKSTDGGGNWTLIYGQGLSGTVTSTGGNDVEGAFFVNDIILYDHDKNPATDAWVFAALGASFSTRSYSTGNGNTFMDELTYGVYKSTDGGSSFNRLSITNGNGDLEHVNDLEVQSVSNRIWLSTHTVLPTQQYGTPLGGRFWYSDDGSNFVRATPNFPAFPDIDGLVILRTEIAPSAIDTDTHYVLMAVAGTNSPSTNIPIIYKTTDNFVNLTYIAPPEDADTGIPNDDFTRGQWFYDLEIEVDPTNNDIVYVGGIDWFRSQDGGGSWSQITKWSNNNNLAALNCSLVHADQHGLYFRPGAPNQAIVANDGGIAYVSSLSDADTNDRFTENEADMITTQFYTVAQSPIDFAGSDYIAGGTQDNGSYALINSNKNNTPSTYLFGGDGAETVFDQVGGDYLITNYIHNNIISRFSFNVAGTPDGYTDLTDYLSPKIPDYEGSFINPGALDSNQDVYFANAGSDIRVITGLERGGSPDTFLITGVTGGGDRITTLEVSRHTTDTSTLFVGLRSGVVKKITNANSDPGYVISGNLHSQAGSVSDIHVGSSENELFVTYYNYGINNNIVYTQDQFSTAAVNKEGNLPNIPVYTLLNNPYESEEVVIGTELGVWRTSNFSNVNPTWTQSWSGMSDVAVFDMDFRGESADNNRAVAASYGRGVYSGSFGSNSNPPVTVTDSITLDEAGTATTTSAGSSNVLTNDTDPEGDDLEARIVTGPAFASDFTLQTSGTFTYTHDGSETTTDSFTYRAFDGAKFGNTVTVTIQINPVNDCPTVANAIDNVNVSENASDTLINVRNVFEDVDIEGGIPDNLSYTVTNTGTDIATVTNNTGTITIKYAEDKFGSFVVTVTVSDGKPGCSPLTSNTFNVNVSSVNEAPVTVTESIRVTESGTVTKTISGSSSVLSNDTDSDGDSLIAQTVTSTTYGSFFSLQTSGTFTYTHDGSETTTDSFSYRAFDGIDVGNTVIVPIQIIPDNDCPTVANPLPDINVQEDAEDTVFSVSSVFDDVDRVGGIPDNLNYTVTHTGAGIATVNLNQATITIDYIDDQTGSFVVTVTVDDGTCTTTNDVFSVTVNPQNDPPIGVADQIILDEGATATTLTGGATSVLDNDSDPESNPLSATLLTQPLHHNDPGNFSLALNGSFSYTHDGSETATDTFFYTLSDGVNNVTVSVTIQIDAVNDCPTVVSPQPDINVNEDDPNTVLNLNNVFGDVDIRPTPNNLTYSFTHTGSGIATVTSNGATITIDYIDDQTGSFIVTTTVDDNTGDFTCSPLTTDVFIVTVNPQNDPPVTIGDELSVLEGGTVTETTLSASSVLENDTDVEIGKPTTAFLVSGPSFGTLSLTNTGSFAYVHNGSETTFDSFTYKSNDGTQDGNTATVSITITKANDCPLTTTGSHTLTYNEDTAIPTLDIGATVSDSDLPADTILYTIVEQTNTALCSVTINNLGVVSFDNIAQHDNGSLTATVSVDDQLCQIEIPIYLTIVPVNDCPTIANAVNDISVSEDSAPVVIDIRNTFTDVESPTLEYTVIAQNNALVAVSTTSTSLIVQFKENQNGNTNIILTAFDGDPGCSPDDIINVNITNVNDPPTGNPDEISVVNGGTINLLNDGVTTSVLANDVDPEGNPLTAIKASDPLNGILTLNANGTFSYTHDGTATTTDVFYYKPTDGFFPGNTTTVTIYINNPAIGVGDTVFVMESGTATITSDGSTSVLKNDSDPDGDALTAVKVTNPSRGTVTLNADGSFEYIHNGSNESTDSFTYSANDGKINSSPITVSINVTGTNDPPVANDDTIIVDVGATATTLDNGQTRVTFNDIDPDADSLTVTLVSSPTHGSLTLNTDGTFSYVQGGSQNSGDSFEYKAFDGTVYSNNATVNIYVSCSPCKESIVEGGNNGVSITYSDPLCKKVRVYIPRGKAYTFKHLSGSIKVDDGTYTLISSVDCKQ